MQPHRPTTGVPSLVLVSPATARPRWRFGARVLAGAVLGVSLLGATAASAQSKIAVIDVQRAVLETEEGLRVQANLKKLFDSRQVDLEAKQRTLQADKEALDKAAQAGSMPKPELQKKYEGLQRQFAELQQTTLDYQREMQRKEHELTTPILQRILGLVRRIATQDGFDMVLEKSAVPYYLGNLDVTDRAIQMFNSGQTGDVAPAGKPGAAPAPTPPKPAAPAPTK